MKKSQLMQTTGLYLSAVSCINAGANLSRGSRPVLIQQMYLFQPMNDAMSRSAATMPAASSRSLARRPLRPQITGEDITDRNLRAHDGHCRKAIANTHAPAIEGHRPSSARARLPLCLLAMRSSGLTSGPSYFADENAAIITRARILFKQALHFAGMKTQCRYATPDRGGRPAIMAARSAARSRSLSSVSGDLPPSPVTSSVEVEASPVTVFAAAHRR